MSQTAPRIPPLPADQWTDAVRDFFAIMEGEAGRKEGSKFNAVLTLAHHAEMASRFQTHYKLLLGNSTIPLPLREIVTLRVSLLCRSEYEWTQHIAIGKAAGLSDAQIAAVRQGADDPIWSDLERSAIRAVDQLKTQSQIDDATWAALSAHFNRQEMIELLFIIGTYTMLCWTFNAAGLQLEAGKTPAPF